LLNAATRNKAAFLTFLLKTYISRPQLWPPSSVAVYFRGVSNNPQMHTGEHQ
jgi:hypothetical protein